MLELGFGIHTSSYGDQFYFLILFEAWGKEREEEEIKGKRERGRKKERERTKFPIMLLHSLTALK